MVFPNRHCREGIYLLTVARLFSSHWHNPSTVTIIIIIVIIIIIIIIIIVTIAAKLIIIIFLIKFKIKKSLIKILIK